MSGKHTPGPWTVEGPDKDEDGWTGTGYVIDVVASHDCDSHPVATLHMNTSCREVEQWQADANLIAAAPDLLAALEWTLDMLSELGCGYLPGDIAIAKAKGEQP